MPSTPSQDSSFLGHPRGLATLFFTEMWERFSFYGMKALLILFMTGATVQGGLGFDTPTAAAIFGLYTAGVYLSALPGGYLADRLWGQERAVLYGGILIAAGHFSLAVPSKATFFAGLVLIVLGTGLLKPNISILVGRLYASQDERREAGFSLFYMGINLGGFLAPLICGTLGEKVDWHWGFGAAGVGMVLGLVQFVLGKKKLEGPGMQAHRPPTEPLARKIRGQIFVGLGLGACLAVGLGIGWIPLTAVQLANFAAIAIVSMAIGFFAYLLVMGGLDSMEKKKVAAIAMLFIFASIFWAGFEQGGSSLSIFARDMTDRVVGGWEFPASWFQFVNSFYVMLLVPVFAVLWTRLGSRQPSVPVKFAVGLTLLGAGFLVLTRAAQLAETGAKVGLGWLVVAYFLHTCGELCLSPVGLSMVTRLAPERFAGQMMGVWFISMSLGNLLAGLVAGKIVQWSMSGVFFGVAAVCMVAGVLMAGLAGPVKGLMGQGNRADAEMDSTSASSAAGPATEPVGSSSSP